MVSNSIENLQVKNYKITVENKYNISHILNEINSIKESIYSILNNNYLDIKKLHDEFEQLKINIDIKFKTIENKIDKLENNNIYNLQTNIEKIKLQNDVNNKKFENYNNINSLNVQENKNNIQENKNNIELNKNNIQENNNNIELNKNNIQEIRIIFKKIIII